MTLPSGQVIWVRVHEEEQTPQAAPPPPSEPTEPADDMDPELADLLRQIDEMGPEPASAEPAEEARAAPVPLEEKRAAPAPSPGDRPAPPTSHGLLGRAHPAAVSPARPLETLAAPEPLHGFTDAIAGIADSVREGLAHAQPDTVEVEFGLDIDVSTGTAISLIADASVKAAVRITLGWDNTARREQKIQLQAVEVQAVQDEIADARPAANPA